jgi:Zn-dependent metalloprotease
MTALKRSFILTGILLITLSFVKPSAAYSVLATDNSQTVNAGQTVEYTVYADPNSDNVEAVSLRLHIENGKIVSYYGSDFLTIGVCDDQKQSTATQICTDIAKTKGFIEKGERLARFSVLWGPYNDNASIVKDSGSAYVNESGIHSNVGEILNLKVVAGIDRPNPFFTSPVLYVSIALITIIVVGFWMYRRGLRDKKIIIVVLAINFGLSAMIFENSSRLELILPETGNIASYPISDTREYVIGSKREIIEQRAGKNAVYSVDLDTGKLRSIYSSKTLLETSKASELSQYGTNLELAKYTLDLYRDIFDLDVNYSFKIESSFDDISSYIFQEYYKGIKVYGAQAGIKLVNNKPKVLDANLTNKINLDVNPKITQAQALNYVIADLARSKDYIKQKGQFELLVFDPTIFELKSEKVRLVWGFDVQSSVDDYHYFIDAQDGSVVFRYSTRMYMSRRIYEQNTLKRSEGQAAVSGKPDVNNAYDYVKTIHDYWYSSFSRNGANNSGGTNGTYTDVNVGFSICLGGEGGYLTTFGQSIVLCQTTKEILAHEYFHAVSFYSFKMNPMNESGAINEGLAEAFGEYYQKYNTGSMDWVANGKSISNPESNGRPGDFYSSKMVCGGLSDSGGIHTNASLMSRWAYLVTNGGTVNGCTIRAMGVSWTSKYIYNMFRGSSVLTAKFSSIPALAIAACDPPFTLADCSNAIAAMQALYFDQPGYCNDKTGALKKTPACAVVVVPLPQPSVATSCSGTNSIATISWTNPLTGTTSYNAIVKDSANVQYRTASITSKTSAIAPTDFKLQGTTNAMPALVAGSTYTVSVDYTNSGKTRTSPTTTFVAKDCREKKMTFNTYITREDNGAGISGGTFSISYPGSSYPAFTSTAATVSGTLSNMTNDTIIIKYVNTTIVGNIGGPHFSDSSATLNCTGTDLKAGITCTGAYGVAVDFRISYTMEHATPTPTPSRPCANSGNEYQVYVPGFAYKPNWLPQASWFDSNCDKPTRIVLHWSGAWTDNLNTFNSLKGSGSSCTIGTDLDGAIMQFIPLYDNGVPYEKCIGSGGLNDGMTISNEIVGSYFYQVNNSPVPFGNSTGKGPTDAQIQSTLKSTCMLMKKYGIPLSRVYGHHDLVPDNPDPGEQFMALVRKEIGNGYCTGVTYTPTKAPTNTPTKGATSTPTKGPTSTPTRTPTGTILTNTPTQTPTNVPTPTVTLTPTITPTIDPSITVTVTPIPTITSTIDPSITVTITESPTATPGEGVECGLIDVNDDALLNIYDLMSFAKVYRHKCIDVAPKTGCGGKDVVRNGATDGEVNIYDFIYFAQHYYTVTNSCTIY